jgi:hypothetical protein
MGQTQYKATPLVERILSGTMMDNYVPPLSTEICPICDRVLGHEDDAVLVTTRDSGGYLRMHAWAHERCEEWFDRQVDLAKGMLCDNVTNKFILLSGLLCRDIIGKILEAFWPRTWCEITRQVFEYMRDSPGLFP